jgi:hypothetical protein
MRCTIFLRAISDPCSRCCRVEYLDFCEMGPLQDAIALIGKGHHIPWILPRNGPSLNIVDGV